MREMTAKLKQGGKDGDAGTAPAEEAEVTDTEGTAGTEDADVTGTEEVAPDVSESEESTGSTEDSEAIESEAADKTEGSVSAASPAAMAAEPGDVAITSFTIASSATGAERTDGVSYNTYVNAIARVTVRGAYETTKNDVSCAIRMWKDILAGKDWTSITFPHRPVRYLFLLNRAVIISCRLPTETGLLSLLRYPAMRAIPVPLL